METVMKISGLGLLVGGYPLASFDSEAARRLGWCGSMGKQSGNVTHR